MSNRHEDIQKSYKQLGNLATLYDGIITRSTLLGRMMCSLIWGLDKESAEKWLNDALSSIPDDFKGKLLEVPVGTGVLTMPMYKKLSAADITCLDFSDEMMSNAQKRAQALKIHNVSFVQGDVGKLPFENESFDIVLSLNGFHAFPDKDAAFKETSRVLKPGGIFCGCFYIRDEFKRTDFFVDKMYVPKSFFTPPFETRRSLEDRLNQLYSVINISNVNAEGIFTCVK